MSILYIYICLFFFFFFFTTLKEKIILNIFKYIYYFYICKRYVQFVYQLIMMDFMILHVNHVIRYIIVVKVV